jgi:hypothetical protein
MPYQEHIATCMHCGASFTSGDAIEDTCWPCTQNGHRGTLLDCPVCARRETERRRRIDEAIHVEKWRGAEVGPPSVPSSAPPRRPRLFPRPHDLSEYERLQAENIILEAEVDRLGRQLADRARLFDECAAFDDALERSLRSQGVTEEVLTRAIDEAQKAMEDADHTEVNDG